MFSCTVITSACHGVMYKVSAKNLLGLRFIVDQNWTSYVSSVSQSLCVKFILASLPLLTVLKLLCTGLSVYKFSRFIVVLPVLFIRFYNKYMLLPARVVDGWQHFTVNGQLLAVLGKIHLNSI